MNSSKIKTVKNERSFPQETGVLISSPKVWTIWNVTDSIITGYYIKCQSPYAELLQGSNNKRIIDHNHKRIRWWRRKVSTRTIICLKLSHWKWLPCAWSSYLSSMIYAIDISVVTMVPPCFLLECEVSYCFPASKCCSRSQSEVHLWLTLLWNKKCYQIQTFHYLNIRCKALCENKCETEMLI